MSQSAEVVICGAGSAGVATAYYLAKHQGITNVLVVDRHPPLTQTSAKSGENYRNWWPTEVMVRFTNRSIDLMEELARASNNALNMDRRGYAYVTSDPEFIVDMHDYTHRYSQLGIGDIRTHGDTNDNDTALYSPPACQGFEGQPDGADLLLSKQVIKTTFPHFSDDVQAVIHARRCGSISAQQLGMTMLEEARKLGIRELRAELVAIEQDHHGVKAVEVIAASGKDRVETRKFANAAGPFAPHVAAMLDIALPVFSVLQQKIVIQDHLGVVARDAPFTIFMDEQYLDWSEDERQLLQSEPEYQWLLDKFPGGLHIRPEGGKDSPWIKLGWAFNRTVEQPVWEPEGTPEFPDLVLHGASRLIPGLKQYIANIPKPVVRYAGYYTKTKENLPIIGPLGVEGAYIVGALSGFGTMVSCAAGELVAAWVAGSELPDYARQLSLARYDDPAYVASLDSIQPDGEL
jgi:glycine/D-amino acid oxidase-like deaminating enzyme